MEEPVAHAGDMREGRQVQRRQPGTVTEEQVAHAGEVREGRQVQRRQPGAAVEEPVAHAGDVREGRQVQRRQLGAAVHGHLRIARHDQLPYCGGHCCASVFPRSQLEGNGKKGPERGVPKEMKGRCEPPLEF